MIGCRGCRPLGARIGLARATMGQVLPGRSPLRHARTWFVSAVAATTTALLVVVSGGFDDAGLLPPGQASGQGRQAAVVGLTVRTIDDADAASRASERRDAADGDVDLTRAARAWERALTASAEAWFRGNPAAPSPAAVATAAPVAPAPAPTTAVPEAVPAPAARPTAAPTAAPPAAPPAPARPAAPTPSPQDPPAADEPTDFRAAAEAFLDTLPGGSTATIEWGDPHGHLGGVWIPGSETIILHAQRLDGRIEQTKDVLRHEIGHVHQNRAMAASGWSLPQFEAHLDGIFGGEGIERSADAVALLLGAESVRYASSFTEAQYDAARALLEDRVP